MTIGPKNPWYMLPDKKNHVLMSTMYLFFYFYLLIMTYIVHSVKVYEKILFETTISCTSILTCESINK